MPNLKIILAVVVVVALGAAFNFNGRPRPAVGPSENPKVAKLKLLPGFKAEHLYSPSEKEQGSWVAMAFDHKGRLIVSDQYGDLFRLQIPAVGAGTAPAVEKLKVGTDTLGIGYAHGLLYAFNSLYVMINNQKNNKKFTRQSGLYRLQDTDNDDQYDKLTLLKAMDGDGEHGPHSIILSPDGQSLFVISGNYTDLPPMDAYRLPSNWKYDNLFPAIKDPRGHANDRKEPGGWIAHTDPEGKRWELISAGYRNAFDMAFNEVGDLFVYDADMEWDFGLPWYRPTRICHATSASEFGWRTGNGKWSATFPDNLPPVINIGQGSPTNLLHTKDAKFPAKYKKTLLAFDWSFGIVHALHLKPTGASYTAEREEFLSGMPLPLTDGVIGPDGALYFLTGGRRLASDLYRVYYAGSDPATTTAPVSTLTPTNELRRSLEKFHQGLNPQALDVAWPYLKHPDRFVRYAARLAVEHQPVAQWQARALTEKDPVAAAQALLALARHGQADQKNAILKALISFNFKTLSEPQQLDLLRTIEVAIARMGTPEAPLKGQVGVYLSAHYPASTANLNRALSKLLVVLETPGTIEKTLALMASKNDPRNVLIDPTATASADLIMRNPQYGLDIADMLKKVPPAQETYYATMLSAAKENWTPALREQYFKWFSEAFNYKGGNSYVGFIDRARKLALKNVPEEQKARYDKLSGGDLLTKNGNDLASKVYPKGPGRGWNVKTGMAILDSGLVNRNFEQGKNMYAATTCNRCHAMRGDGGAIGPDLTQLATRFSAKDMLEAIVEPNKSISDQYAATQFTLKSGESVVGRLTNEDAKFYYVSQNPYEPEVLRRLPKSQVKAKQYSGASIMYSGLINSLNAEEFKDLMAYLMAGGNANSPMYGSVKTEEKKGGR